METLISAGVANSELLEQPVRITRSQWRQSIVGRSEQSTGPEADRFCVQSSNPGSRNTSRSSSRTVSPDFRLREPEKIDESLLNGRLGNRNSSGSQSPEPKKVYIHPSVPEKGSKQGRSSRTSSRTGSPEHFPGSINAEERSKDHSPLSKFSKGRSRTQKKKTTKSPFVAGEEHRSSKNPAVLGALGSKIASAEEGASKECETSALLSSKFTSKSLWTSKAFENTSKVAGKKRVRSLSKTQESAGKREKTDESSLVDKSDSKGTATKSGKTGGRLSRGRTSHAQSGERRSTTGSCASNRFETYKILTAFSLIVLLLCFLIFLRQK